MVVTVGMLNGQPPEHFHPGPIIQVSFAELSFAAFFASFCF
jgi:hypothetical protein